MSNFIRSQEDMGIYLIGIVEGSYAYGNISGGQRREFVRDTDYRCWIIFVCVLLRKGHQKFMVKKVGRRGLMGVSYANLKQVILPHFE